MRIEKYKQKYRTFTIDFLIKRVIELWPDDYPKMVGIIASWKLEQNENFLMSLLINRQDKVACMWVDSYLFDANEILMIFCLRNQNEVFMKHALQGSLFGMTFLSMDSVVKDLLFMMQSKAKTEFVLNCLLYVNWSQWTQGNLA